MILTSAISGGKKSGAIAAISMLPVSTPTLAISQLMMPEQTRISVANNPVRCGFFNVVFLCVYIGHNLNFN